MYRHIAAALLVLEAASLVWPHPESRDALKLLYVHDAQPRDLPQPHTGIEGYERHPVAARLVGGIGLGCSPWSGREQRLHLRHGERIPPILVVHWVRYREADKGIFSRPIFIHGPVKHRRYLDHVAPVDGVRVDRGQA